ncbi:MAG TPA: DUF4129 domain-containing protein [Mycobacteriales bacterium]|nr:DUF4129 domain-containing protein [Mycobacteriales bacterium]
MIGASAGGGPITRDGAREAARRELSKGIYHRNDEPWPVRVLHAVQRWLDHLMHTVSRHAPGGGAGAVGLLLVAIALLAFVWWRVGLVRRTPAGDRPLLQGRPRTSTDLLREAEAAAVCGRWDEALIARMRALAMAAEERGIVDPRPGRTADELAAEIALALPAATNASRSAATTFDAVRYGKRDATRESYDVIVTAADLIDREHRGRRLVSAAGR